MEFTDYTPPDEPSIVIGGEAVPVSPESIASLALSVMPAKPRPLDEIVEAVTLIGMPEMDEVPWDKVGGDGRGCSECSHFNSDFYGPLRPPYRCPIRNERCECRAVPAR